MDKLDKIFDAQETFRRIMGKGQDCIVDLMDEKQKGQLVYDHIQAIQSELQELINCIYWKSWTKEAKEGKRYMFRNVENAKEEVADILCFLGDICAALGMTAEELTEINVRKTEINIDRQKNKYAMDTKDGKDSEQLWKDIKSKIEAKQEEFKAPLVDIVETFHAQPTLNRSFMVTVNKGAGIKTEGFLLDFTYGEMLGWGSLSVNAVREKVLSAVGKKLGTIFEIGTIEIRK